MCLLACRSYLLPVDKMHNPPHLIQVHVLSCKQLDKVMALSLWVPNCTQNTLDKRCCMLGISLFFLFCCLPLSVYFIHNNNNDNRKSTLSVCSASPCSAYQCLLYCPFSKSTGKKNILILFEILSILTDWSFRRFRFRNQVGYKYADVFYIFIMTSAQVVLVVCLCLIFSRFLETSSFLILIETWWNGVRQVRRKVALSECLHY